VEALPKIEGRGEGKLRKNERARTAVEEGLAAIWEDVLGAKSIGIHSNFFELGGHSLLATQLISRVRRMFSVEVGLRELFEEPTVMALANKIEEAMRRGTGIQKPEIKRTGRSSDIPLSFAQQRLWFIDQMESGGSAFNVYAAVRVRGNLNQQAFQNTLTEIVRRHEVLRTRFGVGGGQPIQIIDPPGPFEITESDLTATPAAEQESEIERIAREEALRPFNLLTGPLLRTRLLKLAERDQVVVFTTHHIVSDGWSMRVLINEIAALYPAFAEQRMPSLPDLPVQYADFAVWQREWLQGEVLEGQIQYWRDQLNGAAPELNLPTDFPRSPAAGSNGANEIFILPQELLAKLKAVSRSENVTLYVTLLAAFQALMHRWSGQTDILVGTDIANRTQAETEDLIGFLVNQLVMRSDLSGNPSFSELLKRVREVTLGAYSHQDLPFEKLVEVLNPDRSNGKHPLFQVKLHLDNIPREPLELPGLQLDYMEIDNGTAALDLTLTLWEHGDALSGRIRYNTSLFRGSTIVRMIAEFRSILECASEDAAIRLDALNAYLDQANQTRKKAQSAKLQEAGLSKLAGARRKALRIEEREGEAAS
ncbi:MAG: non-ribosomal peptide synthetase, partial [Blastocatellia bacterium AA13]